MGGHFDPHGLLRVNCAFSDGELSASQLQAVITLIEKKERDERLIKNWRPISLLNVDAKDISKCLANRVKKVISSLISSDQTAYVPGRYIGESVRLTSDLPEYTDIVKALTDIQSVLNLWSMRGLSLLGKFKF